MKKLLLAIIVIPIIFACQKRIDVAIIKENVDLEFDKAGSFFGQDNDSAFYYYNKVATQSKDSLLIGKAYSYMAVIQNNAGDYFGSIESALAALKFLDPENKEEKDFVASNYNELVLNSIRLNNYVDALKYCNEALNYLEDNPVRLIVLNNMGLAFREQKAYAKAIKIYDEILSTKSISKKEYARTLTNSSFAKWLQNSSYNASNGLLTALYIRKTENDWWGQNSSYAHLADYYSEKKPDSALFYARNMFAIAKKINSPGDKIEALQKLIKLSPADSTKHYFETYQQLSDSVLLAQNAAKNQFALIRYETEKHKADNLKLQQDIANKKYQIIKQRIILIGIICLVITAVIVGILWYKKRKQRIELEAQNRIKESRLKTSKKVHDVVANGLYRVMAEIENQRHIDKEDILDRLENMYEKSRDISYEAEEIEVKLQNFNEKIADLLTSFATENTKVLTAGNESELWYTIDDRIKHEIEHVLQELMVNMRKHSRATHVALRFEQEDNSIHIHYTDNGVGMKRGIRYNNGLTNTGNRIKAIGGQIIFDTNLERGLKIHISFPI
ncbi:ATP-binding protein [Olivibacter sp. CPCC 100613]|uniref:tetratricopeptide repeat-containing sensor histidine kinase n=1 Tax=Olivibacter sp. CPCC 100613 TaxID=3079931 RepID=UPI002FF84E0F